ncbi:surface lipoprotein assembly modifier [Pseudaestuariivita rosea]|uniref:surface lipoprotein assembly modifier n=1 Tax=Pseudaestuariivita rosea TaxID=2763263 RepID=UPI001ABB186E|nr:surface lipoprotein assembly modifier [Pseudaestuariivita rosea]
MRLIFICITALLVTAASAGPSRAQSLDQQLVTLIAQNRLAEAEALLNTTNPTPTDRQFFQGRIHKANGRYDQAIATFQDILARDPDYLNARRELAHTLLLDRQYGASARQFRLLLRIDQNETMQAGYRTFLRVIENERPFGVGVSFALLPSTNINRATTNETFDPDVPTLPTLQIDGEATSGTGVLFGLNGFYRHRLSERDRLIFDAGLTARRYPDDIFDSTTRVAALTFERRERTYGWALSAYQRNTETEDDDDNIATGLSFGLNRQIGPKTVLSLSALQEYRSYLTTDTLDGGFLSTGIGLSYDLQPNLTLAAGTRLSQYSARSDAQAYVGRAFFGRATRTWDNQTEIGLGLEIGERDYAGDYPLTTRARADDYYRVDITLSNRRLNWRTFTPHLRCAYTDSTSNIEFFDYTVTECELTLRRTF